MVILGKSLQTCKGMVSFRIGPISMLGAGMDGWDKYIYDG
jgi:hypothetical protein